MKEETAKLKKFGSFFWLLLLGLGIGLPVIVSLLICLFAEGPFRLDVFFPLVLVFGFIIWMVLLMLVGYGSLTRIFVNRTAQKV